MSGAAPEQQGTSGVSAGKELGSSRKSVGMCPWTAASVLKKKIFDAFSSLVLS